LIVIEALVAVDDVDVVLGLCFVLGFALGLGAGTTFGTFWQAVAGQSVNGPSSAPV
jgi:hypothetical protein